MLSVSVVKHVSPLHAELPVTQCQISHHCMVKSNRVAFDTTDDQLGTQPSNADAIPLLRQGSAQPVTAANSLQSKRSAAIKRKTDKGSGEDASEPTLQAVLEDWDPPNDKAAKLAHVKTHYHHELFSLSDTKTEDLAEFGQGLALYFYFLKWTAMLLAAMSVVVLPNMIWSAIARNGGTSTTGEPNSEAYTLCSHHVLLANMQVSTWYWSHCKACSAPRVTVAAGLLVATSLGAYGPLFGSDYVYNATALEDDLMSLGVTFPNNQLQRGEQVHEQATEPGPTAPDTQLDICTLQRAIASFMLSSRSCCTLAASPSVAQACVCSPVMSMTANVNVSTS